MNRNVQRNAVITRLIVFLVGVVCIAEVGVYVLASKASGKKSDESAHVQKSKANPSCTSTKKQERSAAEKTVPEKELGANNKKDDPVVAQVVETNSQGAEETHATAVVHKEPYQGALPFNTIRDPHISLEGEESTHPDTAAVNLGALYELPSIYAYVEAQIDRAIHTAYADLPTLSEIPEDKKPSAEEHPQKKNSEREANALANNSRDELASQERNMKIKAIREDIRYYYLNNAVYMDAGLFPDYDEKMERIETLISEIDVLVAIKKDIAQEAILQMDNLKTTEKARDSSKERYVQYLFDLAKLQSICIAIMEKDSSILNKMVEREGLLCLVRKMEITYQKNTPYDVVLLKKARKLHEENMQYKEELLVRLNRILKLHKVSLLQIEKIIDVYVKNTQK
ncbi:uncharacterized protein NESG_00008 [Nematocida ausubeli]|uniref:Uncharacterized protein n=1 Tax=Nematocida ausubeli (strain ATCC PRA-371 / ERTm2) TaxID=1913371 RepID=A0A086J471_NEMA1|nr:uncharacterized protein NESG_00008 [Nematocida ausubeli]KFG26939.1 hypothetical protein NESG_00008 [Nematocida ausubeli]